MKIPTNNIEITAKTLEEAIAEAAEQFKVTPKELQIETIEETKKLFGRGHIRIRATLIPEKLEESSKKTLPKGRKTNRKVEETTTPQKETHMEIDMSSEEHVPEKDVNATEDDAAEYLFALREILKLADIKIKAQLKGINGRYVNVQLDGTDIGLLLTRRAEALNSLQYLLNIIISRKLGKNIRVTLDAGEYRQRREDSLCKLAEQIAKEVILRGEEAVLDVLPAFERRVIHNYLQGMKGIRTYSEGDEPNRCVVIAPAE